MIILMKLLLTSAGIQNASLANALVRLVGTSPEQTKVGFIPTAANVEDGNKDWFIRQVTNLQKYGFDWIDVIDVSAPEVRWRERLSVVDVVLVGGGNTFHLLDQVRKTGFGQWLEENIENKVYVGISAGTIIVTPSIAISGIDDGDKNLPRLTDLTGLELVDFEISPHTPEYVSHEANRKYFETSSNPIYAIDDQTAIQVDGMNVRVISEGGWVKY